LSRNAVLNAFSPAQEVTEPELFAGRAEQVKALSDALRTAGSCPVIYGDRGLGKTSLAIQAQRIAMGEGQLLHELSADDRILSEEETFLTFFVTCADDVLNFMDLQQRILNSFRSFIAQDVESGDRRVLVDRQTRRKLSFKFFETEVTNKYDQRADQLREQDFNLTELIQREAELLVDCYGQRILVIIDELDRVKDVSGLASFLKALSGDQLKFVLVGIGQSLSDLDLDHPSIERHLWAVSVPRMTGAELNDIIDRALMKLESLGHDYAFDASARRRLAKAAGGFPWFVHVIGQRALILALQSDANVVSGPLITSAINGLVRDRFAQRFKDTYQRAVRDSMHREIVLRTFAAWPDSDIPTAIIYGTAKSLLVLNPTVYKGHLCSPDYGAPLMVPGFQERGLVRFRDEMFKQYVNLTPSLFQEVSSRVFSAAATWGH